MSKSKKLIIIIIFTLFVALLSFATIYGLGKYNIENSLNDYWYSDENKTINSSDIIRCNISFLKPNVAFISDHILLDDIDELKIYFYGIKNIFSQKDDNREFIGVTTVTNITFPELVAMVKEDCSQFQDDYNNPDPNGIDWGYREADPPEPPKTQEELEYEAEQNYYDEIRSIKYIFNETFTDFQQEKFIEMFGDVNSLSNDEVFNIKQRIYEGGGLEVVFKEYLFDEDGNVIFREQE